MTVFRAVAFLAILLWTGSLVAEPNEPNVEVELSQDQVYEGQSVLYRITVNNVEKPSPPELKGFDDFEVAPRGEVSLNSTQISLNFNGRRMEIQRSGRQYNYQLTPRKTGLLRIPGPTIRLDGRVLQGRELSLNVRPSADQDVAILQVALDRPVVRPLQPFTLTLSVFVKGVEGEDQRKPLALRGESIPSLRIPWATDDRLPKGIQPLVAWNRWLQPLVDRSGVGFSINDLRAEQDSLFFRASRLAFQPKPEKVTRPNKNGQPTAYWRYDFTRTFSATKLGHHALGQVVLEGSFATRLDRNGRLLGETIYAVSKQVDVAVEDAPPEGRPEGYIRAFGHFQAKAELVPAKARTGDPMTLTLSVSGQGTFQDATAPDLSRVAEIARRFKVYEATQEAQDGSCRFTYGLRPLEAGRDPFPAVTLAYYDPAAERYESIHTEPLPVEVTQAEQLSSGQIVAGAGGLALNRRELEARREGIFANITDPAAIGNQAVDPAHWLLGLAGAVGAYLAVTLIVVQVRRRTSDPAAVRRRAAGRKVRDRLAAGVLHLAAGRTGDGSNPVQAALVGLVADLANLPEAGLTAKDVCRELTALGVEDELVGQTGRLLDTCDAARYGASSQDPSRLGVQAEELLGRLLLSLQAKKRFR